jgi:hypothetical protein
MCHNFCLWIQIWGAGYFALLRSTWAWSTASLIHFFTDIKWFQSVVYCPACFLELGDLFSLSSSPMSPVCNLKRSDGHLIGRPKHQTVSFFCPRGFARYALDIVFLKFQGSLVRSYVLLMAFRATGSIIYIELSYERKATLENFGWSCCRQSQTRNFWGVCDRGIQPISSRDWGDIIAGCPGKALPAG